MLADTLYATPAARVSTKVDVPGLMWTLTRTDFKTRYHGTAGGFVWALLKPALMFLVLFAVFSFVFPSEPSYRLNLLLGLFLWDFFAETTRAGLGSLYAKAFLLTKVRFPSWVVVITSAANAFITLTVFTAVFLLVLLGSGHHLSAGKFLLYLLYVVCLTAIVTGVSLGTSVVFLRYRDLNQVWDVIVQAGFFLTPIVYPIHVIPERFHFYLYFWPPTPIIQFSRSVLVDGDVPTLRAHAMLAVMTLSILGLGIAMFRRYGRRAAEFL